MTRVASLDVMRSDARRFVRECCRAESRAPRHTRRPPPTLAYSVRTSLHHSTVVPFSSKRVMCVTVHYVAPNTPNGWQVVTRR